jgi:protein tyrosine phosphatase (PTP) superfamily phosphohydrolase (DUF442 family)/cytochrome c556
VKNHLRMLFVLVVCGCSSSAPTSRILKPTPVDSQGLHNVFRVNDQLYSGSSPEGETGFKDLQNLGIKTIISVDGAHPEVELAKKHGLNYVHLPVNYDGISQQKAWLIAKAVRDLPGPIYLHCHHGRHRGPTAAAVARLCLEPTYTVEEAESWLKTAGIDPKYRGLTSLPKVLVRPTREQLDLLPNDFPSIATVSSLTKRMVQIDLYWDALKAARKSDWAQADDAAHTALQLYEQYRELNRLPTRKEPKFLEEMNEAEQAAKALEEALRQRPLSGEKTKAAFEKSQALCHRCHSTFRD